MSAIHRITARLFPLLLVLAGAATAIAQAPARPVSLEERKAEIESLAARLQQETPLLQQAEARMLERIPEFEKAEAAVESIHLSTDEREALHEGGTERLHPVKKEVFDGAGPIFQEMDERFQAYFDAYDSVRALEIRMRIMGYLVQTLTHAKALEPVLTEKQRTRVYASLTRLGAADEKYRDLWDRPGSTNWDRVSSADKVWEEALAADAVIDPLLVKAGLEAPVPWGGRLRKFGEKVAYYARGVKATLAAVPAMARITAYLLNPFRKKGDPKKFSGLLRSLGRSYAWSSGMRLTVVGRDNVPEDRSIVYALSHRSGLEDVVTMANVLPTDFSLLAAWGVFPKPFREKLVREPNLILVGGHQKGHPEEKIDAVKASIETLKNGLDLAIFPEGATPTRSGETHPLRRGVDAITAGLAPHPVSIVPVTLDDPSQDFDDLLKRRSLQGPLGITVTFARSIDPLKFRAVPGSSSRLLLNAIRAEYHRVLYKQDWDGATSVDDLGVIPDVSSEPEPEAAADEGALPVPAQ